MFATDSRLAHPPNFTLANAGRTIHVGFGLDIHVEDARRTPRQPAATHTAEPPRLSFCAQRSAGDCESIPTNRVSGPVRVLCFAAFH